MRIDYQHRFSAHCESGTVAGLLQHGGVPLNEPMVFGLGSGLFFAYIPFLDISILPFLVFRNMPGSIIRLSMRRLGLRMHRRRFRDPEQAMDELDAILDRGIPVGLQVCCYWLPYLKDDERVHFNMHNTVVFGKEGDNYLISDSFMVEPVTCPADALQKARFAKGMLAPRGLMYYIEPGGWRSRDLKVPLGEAIEDVCKSMTRIPLPMFGVRGIRFLADCIEKWPRRFDEATLNLHLSDIVILQEMIGTGGGGFRFLYAAFLKEAGERSGDASLLNLSKKMIEVGELWREFASAAMRFRKSCCRPGETFQTLPAMLRDIAGIEQSLFDELRIAAAHLRRDASVN